MGAKVSFKMASVKTGFSAKAGELNPSYSDGQIIFVEDLGKIYVDFHNMRTCYTPNSLNYVGISKVNPENAGEDGEVTLIDNTTIKPKINDLVVWGKKEFIWREGKEGNNTVTRWFELGDEDAPQWS